MAMLIRKYQPGEEDALWQLRYDTVRKVSIQDYSLEQVQAWAPEQVDQQRWRRKIEAIEPYVCVHEEIIVGYADLQPSGLIDHFFVHHQWQRRGVGRRLFNTIETEANRQRLPELIAHVSITARPFFASRGFEVAAEQDVAIGSQVLRNYKMVKRLDQIQP